MRRCVARWCGSAVDEVSREKKDQGSIESTQRATEKSDDKTKRKKRAMIVHVFTPKVSINLKKKKRSLTG